MVKQNFLTKMLLLCALIVGSSSVWADNIVFDFQQSTNAYGWSGTPANSSDLTVGDTFTNGSVTFTYTAKGSGTTDLRWWSTGDGLRSYKGNKFKIATSSGTIESITISGTCTLSESSSTGGTISNSRNWTKPEAGGVTEVEFECNQSSGAKTIKKVTVTIASSSSGTATTTTINPSGITNTDVYTSTTAGSLSATVKAGETTIEGATVTWSGNNNNVATINASTGAVTLVAAGTVTFTASYAGVEDVYQPSSATYELTVTSSAPVVDYVTLPFSWEGGTSASLTALNGVTGHGLGSDYASGNVPYLIKFDDTGDYIQIKTDSQPGKVTIGVKMIGGATSSKITVQGSSDGETFADVEELTISGAQNAVLTLETTNAFAATVRYVRLLFTKGSNVGVGPITIAKPTTDPEISANDLNIAYNTTNGTIDYTIVNSVEGGVLTAALTTASDWLTVGEVSASSVAFTATENSGPARFATVRLTYTYNTSETVTKDVTVTQAKESLSYTLAKEVVPGKHYIIVGLHNNVYKAMGGQTNNNRTAVVITVENQSTTITSDDVYEVLLGYDQSGYFTIYDEAYGGYLYAACGTGTSNYMRTETELDGDGYGLWTISIDNNGVASVKAKSGSHNVMMYNFSSSIISCYASGQEDIYLFERDGDTGTQEFTVNIAEACTDGEGKYYGTFSAPFAFIAPEGVTVSEIGIDNSGKLDVEEYAEGDIVPANTGVMISSINAGAKTFTSAKGGTSVLDTDNCMHASNYGITAEDMVAAAPSCKYYRLTMHNGNQIGFWWGAEGGAAFALAANKAYLAVPSATDAPSMGLWIDDDTTGIQSIERTVTDNQYYTLDGRRVAQPTKGLYIVNGKKVVIK